MAPPGFKAGAAGGIEAAKIHSGVDSLYEKEGDMSRGIEPGESTIQWANAF
jgi:hypothetical protein